MTRQEGTFEKEKRKEKHCEIYTRVANDVVNDSDVRSLGEWRAAVLIRTPQHDAETTLLLVRRLKPIVLKDVAADEHALAGLEFEMILDVDPHRRRLPFGPLVEVIARDRDVLRQQLGAARVGAAKQHADRARREKVVRNEQRSGHLVSGDAVRLAVLPVNVLDDRVDNGAVRAQTSNAVETLARLRDGMHPESVENQSRRRRVVWIRAKVCREKRSIKSSIYYREVREREDERRSFFC
jgi:hypothetical protein